MTAKEVKRLHQPGWMHTCCWLEFHYRGQEGQRYGIIAGMASDGSTVNLEFPESKCTISCEDLHRVQKVSPLAIVEIVAKVTDFLPLGPNGIEGTMPEEAGNAL